MVVGAVLMDANVRNSHLTAIDDEPLPPTTTSSDLGTLFYRLERVGPALDDFLSSPIVGTGLARWIRSIHLRTTSSTTSTSWLWPRSTTRA